MSSVFLGLADMATPPDGYEKYIWSCKGCVKGIKWCIQHGKKYSIIDKIWNSEAKVDTTVNYLKRIRNDLIKDLSAELNEYIGVDYSNKAWRIMINIWLQYFLFSYYDKYCRVRELIQREVRVDAYLPQTICKNPPFDMRQFEEEIKEDYGVAYQYRLLIEEINNIPEEFKVIDTDQYSIIQKSFAEESISVPTYRWLINSIKNLIKRIIRGVIILRGKAVAISYDSWFSQSRVCKWNNKCRCIVFVESKYWRIRARLLQEKSGHDIKWRSQPLRSKEGKGDDFEKIVYRIIKKEIPSVFAESHARLRDYVYEEYGIYLNAKVFIHGASAIHGDHMLGILCAAMNDRGIKICGVQHGGNYGMEDFWLYDDEYELADIFYTFGWSVIKESNTFFKSMPAVKLMTVYNDRTVDLETEKVGLYVTYEFPRYLFRPYRPEFVYEDTVRKELDFLKELHKIDSNIITRLYLYEYGREIKETFCKEIPNVNIDAEPRFEKSLCRAKYCIFSDWQTTVNEALYLDIPLIVRRDLSFIEGEAKPDIVEMHSVGIVCYTWDELYSRVIEIDGKWDEWWNEPQRKSIVEKMRRKYAWGPNNAEEIWIDEIKRLASESC